jgi:hypothetical protein
MDYLAILKDHLGFIERFYGSASEPFKSTIHKIDAEEEPFVPERGPGDHDGPEYLPEWMEASKCLGVLGNCGLWLLEKALHNYLRAFITRESSEERAAELSKGNWFRSYCEFLKTSTPFEWGSCPVTYDQIEQINLSRNDITHDRMIDRTRPRQSEKHFSKYPTSRFAQAWEVEMLSWGDRMPAFPPTIDITQENLASAIEDVRRFCAFVEGQRTKW